MKMIPPGAPSWPPKRPARRSPARSARTSRSSAGASPGFRRHGTWPSASRSAGSSCSRRARSATARRGRSGGQVLTGANGVEPESDERLRRIYEVTREGIDLVERWIGTLGVADAGFARTGSLEVATTERNATAERARVARWQRAGIPLRWVEASDLGIHGACGGALDPAGARMNPLALVRALRRDLVARGVAVFEESPAVAIERGRVRTPRGEVTAPAVVIAAAAYSPSLGSHCDRILPLHSHVVATAPIAAADWAAGVWGEAACFTDDRDRIAYGTRTPGGRLLFGGGDNAAYEYRFGGSPVPAPERSAAFAAVERRLRAYFPAFAHVPIEHRWTGAVDLTLDRVCSIGADHALGFSGHGLALAAFAGRVIADLHAGDGERWRDLPFVDRVPPRLPPEPLRWLGYQLYTRLTGRSPRRRA